MIVAMPVKGGAAFAGKSGRNTANACETNAMETSINAATHFIWRRLIKTGNRSKLFFMIAVDLPFQLRQVRFSFTIHGLRFFLPADATVYLSCAQCAGRFG